MSKWSSVRCSLVCLAFAVLAACNQQTRRDDDGAGAGANNSGVITQPDTSVDDVASAEPGKDRHQWTASDGTTRALTGNLTASVDGRGGPLTLAFATGITEEGERDVRVAASEPVGVGPANFASVLKANPDAGVFLYRVTNEDIASVAKSGGLCGAERTTFLAAAEYVSMKGEWVFRVAAFKGPNPPGPGAAAEPVLCGAYFYAAP
jgi:hypothetical protein